MSITRTQTRASVAHLASSFQQQFPVSTPYNRISSAQNHHFRSKPDSFDSALRFAGYHNKNVVGVPPKKRLELNDIRADYNAGKEILPEQINAVVRGLASQDVYNVQTKAIWLTSQFINSGLIKQLTKPQIDSLFNITKSQNQNKYTPSDVTTAVSALANAIQAGIINECPTGFLNGFVRPRLNSSDPVEVSASLKILGAMLDKRLVKDKLPPDVVQAMVKGMKSDNPPLTSAALRTLGHAVYQGSFSRFPDDAELIHALFGIVGSDWATHSQRRQPYKIISEALYRDQIAFPRDKNIRNALLAARRSRNPNIQGEANRLVKKMPF